MIKKTLLLAICAILVLQFAACGGKSAENSSKIKSPENIDIVSLLNGLTDAFEVGAGEKYCSEKADGAYLFDDDILAGKYGDLVADSPEVDTMVKYCAFFSDEPYGPEFGVFVFKTEADAAAMKAYVENRISALKRNAKNYPSVDTSLIDNEYGEARGNVFYYCALNDAGKEFERSVLGAVEER